MHVLNILQYLLQNENGESNHSPCKPCLRAGGRPGIMPAARVWWGWDALCPCPAPALRAPALRTSSPVEDTEACSVLGGTGAMGSYDKKINIVQRTSESFPEKTKLKLKMENVTFGVLGKGRTAQINSTQNVRI